MHQCVVLFVDRDCVWVSLDLALMNRVYFQAWAEGELIGETGKASARGAMRV